MFKACSVLSSLSKKAPAALSAGICPEAPQTYLYLVDRSPECLEPSFLSKAKQKRRTAPSWGMRGEKEQTDVFTPFEQCDFKLPGASLCVGHSHCCVTGGSGVLSRALSHISPRRDLSPRQVRYGGSGKGFWSLHPLSLLLGGWRWKRDGDCWGNCPIFLHQPRYIHAWCLLWRSIRKVLLRAAGNSVLPPFWTSPLQLIGS